MESFASKCSGNSFQNCNATLEVNVGNVAEGAGDNYVPYIRRTDKVRI